MSILRIALLQISPCGGTEANLVKGLECCRKAKEMGADIALFPEMWSNGYSIFGREFEEWSGEAIPADGEFVAAYGALAAELDMAIGVTLLEKYNGGLPQYPCAL